jgi:hypothetical protein
VSRGRQALKLQDVVLGRFGKLSPEGEQEVMTYYNHLELMRRPVLLRAEREALQLRGRVACITKKIRRPMR